MATKQLTHDAYGNVYFEGGAHLLRTLSRAAVPYVLIPSQTPLLFLGKSTK